MYVCMYVRTYVCMYVCSVYTYYICTARKNIQYTENVTKYIKKNHQTNDTNSKALNPLVVGITYWILRLQNNKSSVGGLTTGQRRRQQNMSCK